MEHLDYPVCCPSARNLSALPETPPQEQEKSRLKRILYRCLPSCFKGKEDIAAENPVFTPQTPLTRSAALELRVKTEQAKSRLESLKSSKLHHPNKLYQTALPIELAKVLIPEDGKIDRSVICHLVGQFGLEGQAHSASLLNCDYLINLLEALDLPNSPSAPAATVIKAMLKLPASQPLSQADVKRAVLAALISPLRQEQNGSCFATPLAIYLLRTNPALCLQDLSQLIRDGKLTRKIHGVSKDFPFFPGVGNESLETKINLSNPSTWKEPGIQAALQALEVNDGSQSFIGQLAHDDQVLTIKDFLLKAVERLNPGHQEKEDLYRKALIAFQAQTGNLLLSAWENSMAGMAEGEERGMVKSAIFNAVVQVFVEWISSRLPLEKEDVEEIGKQIYEILLDRVYLHYDPSTYHRYTGNDAHSTEGAFVLYDKNLNEDHEGWIRIDSPELFHLFAAQIINQIPLEPEEMKIALLNYAGSASFIKKILEIYFPDNVKWSDPYQQSGDIQYAPWVTKAGNSFKNVLLVYFEKEEIESITYQPRNGAALLEAITELVKKLPAKIKRWGFPVRISGLHAFTLLDINEMKPFPEGQAKLLKKKIIDRDQLFSRLAEEVHWSRKELKKIRPLIPAEGTLTVMRSRLLMAAGETNGTKSSSGLDKTLLTFLTAGETAVLEASALPFADTNWHEEGVPLHFCLIENPFNQEVEIWMCRKNGNYLHPLSQEDWLGERNWEFYPFLFDNSTNCGKI